MKSVDVPLSLIKTPSSENTSYGLSVVDGVIKLSNTSLSSILGHSMILYYKKNSADVNAIESIWTLSNPILPLACGLILPEKHIIAVSNLMSMNGKRVTGRLIFSQIYPSKQVIVVGIIYRLKFGRHKLYIQRHEETGTHCKGEISPLGAAEVKIFLLHCYVNKLYS